jgi:DNA-3-methyladenine glycosylase I
MGGAVTTYCEIAPGHTFHGPYHDAEYGFPLADDDALFERLVLEINQAGLSWLLMLQKREAFRKAFRGFDVGKVARFTDKDRARLLADASIIRNRLKVDACIENARRIQALVKKHGSFAAWIAEHHPRTKTEWVKLFKQTFKFTGGEIVGEFLMSIGYLPGAHHATCPVQRKIAKLKPPWMAAKNFTY